MTALAGTNWSIGYVVDALLSAAFSLSVGRLGLQGLSKVSVVASRGVNELLKLCYFDTSKTDTLANKVATWVPEPVSNFFKDDSGYNDVVTRQKGNGDVTEYKHSWVSLLVSGLGLSLFALIALEMKEALWRPANPILNHVLSYISPFRAVMGQSWAANGIHKMVGAAKNRL
ncbi:MAG TPA: hypothetical protein VFU89_01890 [Rhabdochlamydiaceae bacterium]|nr:hypothetical protein [Rhabdochlamydiaceae bacterium]